MPSSVNASPDTNQSEVISGLTPSVQLRGEARSRWTLAERMAHYRVPGVSIAVMVDQQIEWAAGFGVLETGGSQPVDANTLFQAASISKAVAASEVMRLSQEGRVSLDEDVNRYLTSWRIPENEFTRERKVTLRRLLSHTAGLTVHGFLGYPAGQAVPTLQQVLEGAPPANSAPVVVDIPIGSQFRYSGGGYTVIQQLIEDVTGQPFSEVMHANVLEPVGMSRSRYEQPLKPDHAANAARGHRGDGSLIPGNWHTYPEQAAAGLWTTPSDLLHYAAELQRAITNGSGWLLTHDTACQMITPRVSTELPLRERAMGLGFFVTSLNDPAYFGHGGSNEGYRCGLVASRDGRFGTAIMTNGDNGSSLHSEILMSITQTYGWPNFSPIERQRAPLDRAVLAQYTGIYEFPGGQGSLEVLVSEDQLFFQEPGSVQMELIPAGDHRFFTWDNLNLSFRRGADGRVTGIQIDDIVIEKKAG